MNDLKSENERLKAEVERQRAHNKLQQEKNEQIAAAIRERDRLKAEAAGMRQALEMAEEWLEFNTATDDHWNECEQEMEDSSCPPTEECSCQVGVLDSINKALSGSAGKELLERRTEELGEAYSRGHRDARLAIDKILNDPGKGSMGDIEFSIKALIKERDELKAKLESAEQRAEKAEKACAEMWRALLTHCERGHEFTPGNTYRDGEGRRRCIQCTQTMRIDPDGTVTPLFDEKLLRMAEQRADTAEQRAAKAEKACAEMWRACWDARAKLKRIGFGPEKWGGEAKLEEGNEAHNILDAALLSSREKLGLNYIHKSELESAQASARKWQEKALRAVEEEREWCAMRVDDFARAHEAWADSPIEQVIATNLRVAAKEIRARGKG